jgi:exocyst complex component 7
LYQARIIETGAKKVAQLYTKLVAEGSSGTPPGGPEFTLIPFSPSLLSQLRPLVRLLRTLPLPATHPSHPAASQIQSTLNDAQHGYGEMRGSWSRTCLEAHSKRLLERAETIDAVSGGQEFGVWVENLLALAEVSVASVIT